MILRTTTLIATLVALLATAVPASAQHPMLPAKEEAASMAPALPENLTHAQVRELISRLSDDDVRALLITQLDKAAAADEATAAHDASAVDDMMVAGDRVRDRFLVVLAAAPGLGEQLAGGWTRLTADGRTGAGRLLLALVLAVIAAVIAELVLLRLTGSVSRVQTAGATPGFFGSCGLLALRALCELLAIGVGLLAAAAALFALLSGNEVAPLVLLRVFAVIAFIRGIGAVSRAVLAPDHESLRPVPVGNTLARGVHRRIVAFTALWTLTNVPEETMRGTGVDEASVALTSLVFSGVMIGGLVIMVLQGRAPMADFIRGGKPGEASPDRLIEVLASRWHVLAVAYLLVLWVMAIAVRFGTGQEVSGKAIASLLLMVALPVVDGSLRGICAWVFTRREETSAEAEAETEAGAQLAAPADAEPGARAPVEEPGRSAFELAMVRNGRIVLALFFVMTFAAIWDLDLQRLAETVVGGTLASSLFQVVVTLILAYAVWSLVRAGVEQVMRAESGGKDEGESDGEIGGPGASRVATLLPLFRKVVAIALLIMVTMIVLSALGVNIGPLIAGAGVIGLAIGFGAQTLVKDVISGFFFLLDDAFRMGEYVEVDAIRGSVERISVRSLQLRHHNGPVHTLPFGDIRHITNYSRDWAIMKFEIRLPFNTDINKVRKIIKNTGQEMLEDEAFKEVMLQPLKSQGVNRMDDSALIVRCKFTSKPGEQFVLRREAYTRIQQALAAEGIYFATRRVIVETSDGSTPTPEQLQAAASSDDSPPPPGQQGGPA